MSSNYRKFLDDVKVQKASITNLREAQAALVYRGQNTLAHIMPDDFRFDALPEEINETYQGMGTGYDLPELMLVRQQLIKLKLAALIIENQHALAEEEHPALRDKIEAGIHHDEHEFSALSYQLGSNCEKQKRLGNLFLGKDMDDILDARMHLDDHVREYLPAGHISERFQALSLPHLTSNLWDLRLAYAHRNVQENHVQLMMVDEKLQEALLLGKWLDEGMIPHAANNPPPSWVDEQISMRVTYIANYLDAAETRVSEIERFVRSGYDAEQARYGLKTYGEARLDLISKLTP